MCEMAPFCELTDEGCVELIKKEKILRIMLKIITFSGRD
jgi:hypothetical protein